MNDSSGIDPAPRQLFLHPRAILRVWDKACGTARRRWPKLFFHVRGTYRLVQILLGVGAENSHATASYLLLGVTFVVEGYLLHKVIMHFAQHLSTNSALSGLDPEPLIIIFAALLLVALFFHQLMIFRNFTVDKGKQSHAEHEQTTAVSELASKENAGKRRFLIKGIEIAIYLLFGVLTGEAGYMLTALKEHGSYQIPAWFCTTLGYPMSGTTVVDWGAFLEGLFLLSGAVLCLCVLAWDIVVNYTPPVRQPVSDLIGTFFQNDLASLAIWLSLCSMSVPCLEKYEPLGATILIISTLSYIGLIGRRMIQGLEKLGKHDDPEDARTERV